MEHPFVGRQKELEQIIQFVQAEEKPTKALWFAGTPDIGKTCLLRAAESKLKDAPAQSAKLLFIGKDDTTDYLKLKIIFERVLPGHGGRLSEVFTENTDPTKVNQFIDELENLVLILFLDDFDQFGETVIARKTWLQLLEKQNIRVVVTAGKEPLGEEAKLFESAWLKLLTEQEAHEFLTTLIAQGENIRVPLFDDEKQKENAIQFIITWAGYHPLYLKSLWEKYVATRRINKRSRKRRYIQQFRQWAQIEKEGKNHFKRLTNFWESNQEQQTRDAIDFLIQNKRPETKAEGGLWHLQNWGMVAQHKDLWFFPSMLLREHAREWRGQLIPKGCQYFTTNGLIQVAISNAFFIFLAWFVIDISALSIPVTASLILGIVSIGYAVITFYCDRRWPGRIQ